MRLAAFFFLWASAALAQQPAAAPVEARTLHFRVVGPPESAAAAAGALERARSQLLSLGFTVPEGLTDVVLFSDMLEMAPYSPGRAIGFFQQGADASFLAVAWKDAGDPLRALAHELAHRVLTPWNEKHPLWLREGLADLLSNLQPVAGGIKIGIPIAAHVQALRRGPWLDWRQVISATRDSAVFQDPGASPLFYAQSWLLAHRMVVGRTFSGSLAGRVAALGAPEEPLDRLPEPLPDEILPAGAVGPEAAVELRALEPWEREHRLADLLRAMNRTAPAREALTDLRERFPDRPEPAESLGAIEMDALRYDRAEEWLAEAVRLGSNNPATHYRYSLLLMRPGRPADAAARHARRAIELDSSQPLYWLARAHAEMQLSQWAAARSSLAQMRERAVDPLLQEQVSVEMEEIERRREQQSRPPPRPEPPPKITVTEEEPPPPPPSVSPPPAPPPARRPDQFPGTLTFWGYVRRVQCSEGEKILTVTNPRFTVRVRELAGQPAKLYYAPRKLQRIPCSLKDVEVNVIYRPLASFGQLNGDLVALVF